MTPTTLFSLLALFFRLGLTEQCMEYDLTQQLQIYENHIVFADDLKESYIALVDDFFQEKEANELMEELYNTVPWDWTFYEIDGVQVRGPRKMAWYADGSDWNYMFSLNHVPGVPVTPWSSNLLEIRSKIANLTGIDFNSVLANLYEEPQEHSAWHSDDDPWLGYPEPSDIISISFGESREFHFRSKEQKANINHVTLTHGSLSVMGGRFQEHYQHSVPAVDTQKHYRINLTFRRILYPDRKPLKAQWDS